MRTQIILPQGVYEDLLEHLLPHGGEFEEAAFLFAAAERDREAMRLRFIEADKLNPRDFLYRDSDYLELKDATKARLIKRAHDLKAALIEVHSHVGSYGARFSTSDRAGFRETVPHMWWRLPGRPYAAIVVANEGFDALVWVDSPDRPVALSELVAGGRELKPTNHSLYTI
jgi:hypothetical protein